jgi:hypothetical protein
MFRKTDPWRLLLPLLLLAGAARADKIILKDGSVYEGRIMGESKRAVLISNPPLDPKPHFIELKDVATIVRERRPVEEPSPEEGRFASLSAGISGQAYSSNVFPFSPGPGFYVGGGFRVHPALELGGEFDFIPSLSGAGLAVQDSVSRATREYESFYAYHGGFSAKAFPFYRAHRIPWRAEPYLTMGYHWNRLTPKASGDALTGKSIFGGAGVMIPWRRSLYWDVRFLYAHTSYDSIHFLGADGGLSGVTLNSFELSAGLSYRFL